MAPERGEKSRKRKRKARTEVSSSSESSSESERSSSSPPAATVEDIDTNKTSLAPARDSSEVHDSMADGELEPQPQKARDPEQAFQDFYLKQATKEFANDIDKLRSAPDFNERNVPVLIRALRQGTACFAEGERKKIGAVAE